MTTTYVAVPPPGPSATDKLDFAGRVLLAQPTSPSAATWKSVPELFTPFGQQTTGIAKTSG